MLEPIDVEARVTRRISLRKPATLRPSHGTSGLERYQSDRNERFLPSARTKGGFRGVVLRTLSRTALIFAVLNVSVGCNGRASYTIASLEMKRVSATEALTINIDADECYHWTNEYGELCVALQMKHRSLLGEAFSRQSVASFVLGEPPASSGRDYVATRRTARFINHAGFGHTRAASLGGTVGVWNFDKATINGRFRFTTVQQSYSVLTGWTGRTKVLYVGEFRSVPNQAAGEAILAETEKDGMERKRPVGVPRRIQGPFPSKPTVNGDS